MFFSPRYISILSRENTKTYYTLHIKSSNTSPLICAYCFSTSSETVEASVMEKLGREQVYGSSQTRPGPARQTRQQPEMDILR